jgi:adenylate cyclase
VEQSNPLMRRLAALLSADVVGYSRLMGADDIGTVRTLTTCRGVMRDLIRGHRGRVVDAPGDNLLAEFGSVVDAVESAVLIQHAHRVRNAELPAERQMQFRIGINLGDVIVEGRQLFGDGVNIAARLESLAEAGGVCLSGTAYDQVVDKLPYSYELIGERTVKNIARPLRVYRVLIEDQPPPSAPLTAVGKARRQAREARPRMAPASRVASGVHRASIAVLPFREYDVPGERSYFADGIVEDVVGALASIPDVFVISRGSTLPFRGEPTDVRSVGRKLGVRYLVSGSVRRAGNVIRTIAELCDAETRAVLWTDRLDGSVDDLFALQDRLSQRIATTIAPHLRQAELRRALRKRPDSLDAYDFVLRGLDLLYRLRRDDFERALTMFQGAIEAEPGWATPYAWSAAWHSLRVGQGWSADPAQDYAEVDRLATAALERDPCDARALALCGFTRSYLFHDYDRALVLFERALAASPNSAEAWLRSSPTFSYIGDGPEAKRRAEQSLRLSPLDPHLFLTHTALMLAAYTCGELEEATAWGRKATAENPRYTAAQRILTASLGAAGLVEEAREAGRALLVLEPTFRVDPFCRSYAYREPARREALARHLRSAGLPA